MYSHKVKVVLITVVYSIQILEGPYVLYNSISFFLGYVGLKQDEVLEYNPSNAVLQIIGANDNPFLQKYGNSYG